MVLFAVIDQAIPPAMSLRTIDIATPIPIINANTLLTVVLINKNLLRLLVLIICGTDNGKRSCLAGLGACKNAPITCAHVTKEGKHVISTTATSV
jgi:hypothetical protein